MQKFQVVKLKICLSLIDTQALPFALAAKPRMVYIIWAPSPISFLHVSIPIYKAWPYHK